MPLAINISIGMNSQGRAGASPIFSDLISFWRMEEASGARADSVGTNTLTDNGTVTSGVGKVGTAATFTAANNEWLSVADNASLQLGAFSWTFTAWIFANTLADRGIISRHTGSNAASSFLLFVPNATGVVTFGTISGITLTNLQTPLASIVAATWHFVACGWDEVAKKAWIQIDAGVVTESAVIGTPNAGTRPVEIGRRSESVSFDWDGLIDEVGFWKRKLTQPEVVGMYNAGAGLAYPWGGL